MYSDEEMDECRREFGTAALKLMDSWSNDVLVALGEAVHATIKARDALVEAGHTRRNATVSTMSTLMSGLMDESPDK